MPPKRNNQQRMINQQRIFVEVHHLDDISIAAEDNFIAIEPGITDFENQTFNQSTMREHGLYSAIADALVFSQKLPDPPLPKDQVLKQNILRSQVCFKLINKYSDQEGNVQLNNKNLVIEPYYRTKSHSDFETLLAHHTLNCQYDYFDVWIAASMLKIDIYVELEQDQSQELPCIAFIQNPEKKQEKYPRVTLSLRKDRGYVYNADSPYAQVSNTAWEYAFPYTAYGTWKHLRNDLIIADYGIQQNQFEHAENYKDLFKLVRLPHWLQDVLDYRMQTLLVPKFFAIQKVLHFLEKKKALNTQDQLDGTIIIGYDSATNLLDIPDDGASALNPRNKMKQPIQSEPPGNNSKQQLHQTGMDNFAAAREKLRSAKIDTSFQERRIVVNQKLDDVKVPDQQPKPSLSKSKMQKLGVHHSSSIIPVQKLLETDAKVNQTHSELSDQNESVQYATDVVYYYRKLHPELRDLFRDLIDSSNCKGFLNVGNAICEDELDFYDQYRHFCDIIQIERNQDPEYEFTYTVDKKNPVPGKREYSSRTHIEGVFSSGLYKGLCDLCLHLKDKSTLNGEELADFQNIIKKQLNFSKQGNRSLAYETTHLTQPEISRILKRKLPLLKQNFPVKSIFADSVNNEPCARPNSRHPTPLNFTQPVDIKSRNVLVDTVRFMLPQTEIRQALKISHNEYHIIFPQIQEKQASDSQFPSNLFYMKDYRIKLTLDRTHMKYNQKNLSLHLAEIVNALVTIFQSPKSGGLFVEDYFRESGDLKLVVAYDQPSKPQKSSANQNQLRNVGRQMLQDNNQDDESESELYVYAKSVSQSISNKYQSMKGRRDKKIKKKKREKSAGDAKQIQFSFVRINSKMQLQNADQLYLGNAIQKFITSGSSVNFVDLQMHNMLKQTHMSGSQDELPYSIFYFDKEANKNLQQRVNKETTKFGMVLDISVEADAELDLLKQNKIDKGANSIVLQYIQLQKRGQQLFSLLEILGFGVDRPSALRPNKLYMYAVHEWLRFLSIFGSAPLQAKYNQFKQFSFCNALNCFTGMEYIKEDLDIEHLAECIYRLSPLVSSANALKHGYFVSKNALYGIISHNAVQPSDIINVPLLKVIDGERLAGYLVPDHIVTIPGYTIERWGGIEDLSSALQHVLKETRLVTTQYELMDLRFMLILINNHFKFSTYGINAKPLPQGNYYLTCKFVPSRSRAKPPFILQSCCPSQENRLESFLAKADQQNSYDLAIMTPVLSDLTHLCRDKQLVAQVLKDIYQQLWFRDNKKGRCNGIVTENAVMQVGCERRGKISRCDNQYVTLKSKQQQLQRNRRFNQSVQTSSKLVKRKAQVQLFKDSPEQILRPAVNTIIATSELQQIVFPMVLELSGYAKQINQLLTDLEMGLSRFKDPEKSSSKVDYFKCWVQALRVFFADQQDYAGSVQMFNDLNDKFSVTKFAVEKSKMILSSDIIMSDYPFEHMLQLLVQYLLKFADVFSKATKNITVADYIDSMINLVMTREYETRDKEFCKEWLQLLDGAKKYIRESFGAVECQKSYQDWVQNLVNFFQPRYREVVGLDLQTAFYLYYSIWLPLHFKDYAQRAIVMQIGSAEALFLCLPLAQTDAHLIPESQKKQVDLIRSKKQKQAGSKSFDIKEMLQTSWTQTDCASNERSIGILIPMLYFQGCLNKSDASQDELQKLCRDAELRCMDLSTQLRLRQSDQEFTSAQEMRNQQESEDSKDDREETKQQVNQIKLEMLDLGAGLNDQSDESMGSIQSQLSGARGGHRGRRGGKGGGGGFNKRSNSAR